MKKSIVLMAVLALFGVSGCGADCQDMCEEAKDCPGASAEDKAEDCAKSCEEIEKLAEDTKCSDELDAMMDCGSDQDVCSESANGKCDPEAKAYAACTIAACLTTPALCQ